MGLDHFRAQTLSISHLVLIDPQGRGLAGFFTYTIAAPAKDIETLPGGPGQEVTQPGGWPSRRGLAPGGSDAV